MSKTILITGSTDGIGLDTAKRLLSDGHTVLLHGRNPEKLARVTQTFKSEGLGKHVESYVADLSILEDVDRLAAEIGDRGTPLDILINNAGVYGPAQEKTDAGLNTVFVVNTLAPYLLTKRLLSHMPASGRIINLSSAAQAPVNLDALAGRISIADPFQAYAQSKLAITMWSRQMAIQLGDEGQVMVSINPGSMLGTKMVRDAFGVAGGDVSKGAKILIRAALSDEFKSASGLYFDNDAGRFGPPHIDALNPEKSDAVVQAIETILSNLQFLS